MLNKAAFFVACVSDIVCVPASFRIHKRMKKKLQKASSSELWEQSEWLQIPRYEPFGGAITPGNAKQSLYVCSSTERKITQRVSCRPVCTAGRKEARRCSVSAGGGQIIPILCKFKMRSINSESECVILSSYITNSQQIAAQMRIST